MNTKTMEQALKELLDNDPAETAREMKDLIFNATLALASENYLTDSGNGSPDQVSGAYRSNLSRLNNFFDAVAAAG
jgi:hypothetical protein